MQNNSLKRNAILNIIYKLSSMIFPLIVYPYVSRILKAEYLGKVTFFSNISSYGMLLGSLGISVYGIRAVAKARNNKQKLSKTVKELFILNTIVTALVVLGLIISTVWVSKFRVDRWLFFISIAQIVISAFSMEWLFGGLEQYSYITKRAILFKLISLILIFSFVHTREDYIKYAFIMAISSVGNYVCNFIYSSKFINWYSKEKLELRKHLKPTLTLFASLLAISIYTSLDSVMLGFINGDNAVGLYDVAVKAKTVVLSLINAISTVLLPRLSFYVSQNNESLYKETIRKSIRIILMISIPLTVFFEVEAFDTILILGGESYRDAVLCMMILMPILVISGFSNITGNQVLIPHGLDKYYTKAVVCGAFIDLFLNIVFMPHFGIYGAAFATLIAEIIQMSVQTFYSRQYLRGQFNWPFIKRIVMAALVSGIVTVVVRNILLFNTIVNIMICCGVYGGIYILLLRWFKIEEANEFFRTVLKK